LERLSLNTEKTEVTVLRTLKYRLLDLASEPTSKGVYEHFCHHIGVDFNAGTVCTQFLQVPSGTDNNKNLNGSVGNNIVYGSIMIPF
jgi:hypothetical protein